MNSKLKEILNDISCLYAFGYPLDDEDTATVSSLIEDYAASKAIDFLHYSENFDTGIGKWSEERETYDNIYIEEGTDKYTEYTAEELYKLYTDGTETH